MRVMARVSRVAVEARRGYIPRCGSSCDSRAVTASRRTPLSTAPVTAANSTTGRKSTQALSEAVGEFFWDDREGMGGASDGQSRRNGLTGGQTANMLDGSNRVTPCIGSQRGHEADISAEEAEG